VYSAEGRWMLSTDVFVSAVADVEEAVLRSNKEAIQRTHRRETTNLHRETVDGARATQGGARMPVDVFLVFAEARAAASVKVDLILQLVMEKFNLTNPEAPKKEKVVLNKYERKLNLPSRHRKSVTFDLLSVENPALFANVTERGVLSVVFFIDTGGQ